MGSVIAEHGYLLSVGRQVEHIYVYIYIYIYISLHVHTHTQTSLFGRVHYDDEE